MEILAFIAGLLCAGFPLLIFWMHERETRQYFERDRNEKDAELRRLLFVLRKCGPVTSEVRENFGREGGWVKAWLPTMRDVMNGHAMLAGRFDLIDTK